MHFYFNKEETKRIPLGKNCFQFPKRFALYSTANKLSIW